MARTYMRQGDCIELMQALPAESADMILCDLPYGTTACKWDSVIPFDALWTQYRRIAKPRAAIVLCASQPFTTSLIASNMRGYCYNWVWDKRFGANFVLAKRQPLKTHEDICVFSLDGKMPRYSPLMVKREKPIKLGKNAGKTEAIPITTNSSYDGKVYDEKYPDSQLHFSCREGRGLHPTQKPVTLMEYMIRTYTNEGDVVMDNCMGSGTTGVACMNLGRHFIGFEKDETYFAAAKTRVLAAKNELGLPNG